MTGAALYAMRRGVPTIELEEEERKKMRLQPVASVNGTFATSATGRVASPETAKLQNSKTPKLNHRNHEERRSPLSNILQSSRITIHYYSIYT